MRRPEKPWICVRSRLAGALMAAGVKCERIVNPWFPDRFAWKLWLDPVAVDVIEKFYAEIGKPVPDSVRQYALDNGGSADD